VTRANSNQLRLAPGAEALSGTWAEVRELLKAEVFFGVGGAIPLMVLDDGTGRAVGARASPDGTLFFVPPFQMSGDAFEEDEDGDDVWSAVGERESARLLKFAVSLHETVRRGTATPIPEWANAPQFQSKEMEKIEKRLLKERGRLEEAQQNIASLEDARRKQQEALELLFGQGAPLEREVRIALSLLGFEADEFNDGTHQFDVVLEADGHRYIGECEGKDNKAIDIGKLSQLECCVAEDIAIRDADEFAKAILFGNPHRLHPLDKRGEPFTDRVVKAALQRKVRLVTTVDLFWASLAVRNGAGEDYKRRCRDAVHECEGGIVQFPSNDVA
jgi:hypothetical protein